MIRMKKCSVVQYAIGLPKEVMRDELHYYFTLKLITKKLLNRWKIILNRKMNVIAMCAEKFMVCLTGNFGVTFVKTFT